MRAQYRLFGLALMLGGSLLMSQARAASTEVELESPRIDQGNERSLQRGAAAFVNNCMGCHSLGYMRYSRMAKDMGVPDEDVLANLVFTTDEAGEPTKVGSLMANNMTSAYGKQAFGVVPPDLSLTARSRGVDWIYTYLKSYYKDSERAGTGVNNLVYPGTAMPHVLWEQQGWQVPVYGEEHDGVTPIEGLELETAGQMSESEYATYAADITNFMAYVADPIKSKRHRVGVLVLLFLFGLLAISWYLKKEYWKDIV